MPAGFRRAVRRIVKKPVLASYVGIRQMGKRKSLKEFEKTLEKYFLS